MTWIKSGAHVSVRDLMKSREGALYDIPDYKNNQSLPFIQNLSLACSLIAKHARSSHPNIVIVTDYDCDGVTAGNILKKAIDCLIQNGECMLTCPNRFDDGYGISVRMVEELPTVASGERGLLILADNGITKTQEIAMAVGKGYEALIVDHHLPAEELPDALIVDPWAIPGSEFCEYCAAGLSYRIARELLKGSGGNTASIAEEILFLAAVGTVSDLVPLLHENRVIVRNGLMSVPEKWQPFIKAVFNDNKTFLTADDVGFTLGPCINSIGRYGLLDDEVLRSIGDADPVLGTKLVVMNDKRKADTVLATTLAEQYIERYGLQNEKVFVLYIYPAYAGVLGIAAANLAQKYKRPVILLSSTEDDMRTAVGSGRSYGDFNLKELLDSCASKLIKYGGHKAAAGLTMEVLNVSDFKKEVKEKTANFHCDDVAIYDFEISADADFNVISEEVEKYGPYGMGNPVPMFKINNFQLLAGRMSAQVIGKTKEHLKLNGTRWSAVYFGGAKRFVEMGSPESLVLYGSIKRSTFKRHTRVDVEVKDIEPFEVVKKRSALSERISSLF